MSINSIHQPLRLVMVEPPDSTQQFVGLDDNEDPPIKLVFSRPLTKSEAQAVKERYPDAKVSQKAASAETDFGVAMVTIPLATFSNPARLAGDINAVLSEARKLEAHHRARLEAWREAAAEINNQLM